MAQVYLKHDDWEQIFPEYKQDIENESNDIWQTDLTQGSGGTTVRQVNSITSARGVTITFEKVIWLLVSKGFFFFSLHSVNLSLRIYSKQRIHELRKG